LSVIDAVEDYAVDLFVDTEGENGLGKDFKLNAITIKMASKDQRWLLDAQAFGTELFSLRCDTGKKRTLGEIIESDKIPKVLFDVRADSNAIHGHYNVHLGGVIDLQVMEMVSRGTRPSYRHGLDKCIWEIPDHSFPSGAKEAWVRRKAAGKKICKGPQGFGAFNQRTYPRALEEYAINDVELLPE
jgi:exonuclease 3'-5' domain-containing protein 1